MKEKETAKKVVAGRVLPSPLPLFHPLLSPSHILPSLPQSLSCISLSLMPCFALHFGPPPLLFPPNDVLFHKLFALLPLSFSARVVSCHVSFPCTLVGFLSHQTMSPHNSFALFSEHTISFRFPFDLNIHSSLKVAWLLKCPVGLKEGAWRGM